MSRFGRFAGPCLLVDNSNSRSKFMLLQAGELLPECRVLPTAELSAERLHALLDGWSFDAALIASVVPDSQERLRTGLGCPCHFVSWRSLSDGFLDDYAGRETLGADRIANALALRAIAKFPALSIDLGTAVNYEYVAETPAGPRLLGGAIAPGRLAMRQALSSCTAQLPEAEAPLPVSPLATNTKDALVVGLDRGFIGMQRELMAAYAALTSDPLHVALTGGDASFVLPHLGASLYSSPSLTFLGLKALLEGDEKLIF